MKKKSKLEQLTGKQIERITKHSEARANVPLIKANQVNMRLSEDMLQKAKQLAKAQGVPYTTFLTKLLKEDIERLWEVYENAG